VKENKQGGELMMRVLFAGETWEIYERHLKGVKTMDVVRLQDDSVYLRHALKKEGIDVVHIANHEASEKFPTSVDELKKYGAVLLSDLDANTLLLHPDTYHRSIPTCNRLKLLQQYVKEGGGFAMIGGYFSYQGWEGSGCFHRTPIEEILPVRMYPYDDRREVPDGTSPKVEIPGHPMLAGLPISWPLFLGYNRLKPKEGASVLMTIMGDPFLVVWSYGRGRSAAFASDCAPHWATREFLEWKYYPKFWKQLVQWLASGKE